MLVNLVHAQVGCNRVVHALGWGHNHLVAYAAQNSIVVSNTEVLYLRTFLTRDIFASYK
jgi:hypothetical protein